jgi:hypothetical protein
MSIGVKDVDRNDSTTLIFQVAMKTHQSERLNTKTEGSTRLTYTGLRRELEHLKIETRLII